MDDMTRRNILGILAVGFATSQVAIRSATAEVAQQTASPSASSPLVEPASNVAGTYEVTYQEGYAPALLELGFPEDVLLEMFSKRRQRMTVSNITENNLVKRCGQLTLSTRSALANLSSWRFSGPRLQTDLPI